MPGLLPARVVVLPGDDPFHWQAHRLADALGLPCMAQPGTADFTLQYTPQGLLLLRAGDRKGLLIDWAAGAAAHRRQYGGGELLVKAFGKLPRQSRVLDATAGLGTDSRVLAEAGFRVTAVERNPVLHALLADALQRAGNEAALAGCLQHLQLCCADAVAVMRSQAFDAVYLDPMFPVRDKAAAVKKPMVYLQALLGEGTADDALLLQAALACARCRVVVKRPLKAPCLPGPAPDAQYRGKAVRFDAYVIAGARRPDDGG